MSACEKCWSDAHSRDQFNVAEEYSKLIDERRDHPCTPEEQAGPDAGRCGQCGRKTIHQFTREPMCGCQPEHVIGFGGEEIDEEDGFGPAVCP